MLFSQATDWEKIFTQHISDKGLISRRYFFKVCKSIGINYFIFLNGKRLQQTFHNNRKIWLANDKEKVLNTISHQGNAI